MRIGTRGSALAMAQAHAVADAFGGGAEVVEITTTGDRDRAREDKAKWVDTIERALLAGEVDVAVHSAKDVPTSLPDGLVLVGCLPREDPRDVLVGARGPRIGTASLRRAAQLRAGDPSLEVVELRGNVDTRLRKLADGEVDGIVLAAAGLNRLGRSQGAPLDDHVPAAGQGVVVLEAREDFVCPVRDEAAWAALLCERACVRALEADCHSAVGAHHDGAVLRCWVGAVDGSTWLSDAVEGPPTEALGVEVAARLLAVGARELLHG